MRTRVVAVAAILAAAVVPISACGGNDHPPEAKTVTVTASPAAESGVTWKYLQTEYGGYLARKCDDQADNPTYNACIGLQYAGLDSFEKDAKTLPPSKARSDLLSSIDRWRNNYQKFSDATCQLNRKKLDCIAPDYGISNFDLFGTIVNREAAK